MKNPQIGEVFYRVSFVDPDLTIPRVEPMIFAGTNLFPEHENPGLISYYFHHPHEVEPDDTSDRLPIDLFLLHRKWSHKLLFAGGSNSNVGVGCSRS